MRYLLSLLVIFSIGFAQKTTVIKKHVDDEKKIEVEVKVADDKVLYSITKDGKTEEFEADIDDEDAMAKIHDKLAEHKCEALMPAKKKCDKDMMVLRMKDKDCDKNIKIIKKHKIMDEPILINDKAGFLGVQIQDLSKQLSEYFKLKNGNGVLVSEVVEGSPAEKSGLKAGDIIIKVEDEDIENAGDLTTTIRGYEPETKVSIAIIRNGKKKQLEATLGKSEQDHFYKFGDFGERGDKHKMLLKMYPETFDNFKYPGFPFDKNEFKAELDEMRKELKKMKEELKQLQDKK